MEDQGQGLELRRVPREQRDERRALLPRELRHVDQVQRLDAQAERGAEAGRGLAQGGVDGREPLARSNRVPQR
jgi:hypothetical protein